MSENFHGSNFEDRANPKFSPLEINPLYGIAKPVKSNTHYGKNFVLK